MSLVMMKTKKRTTEVSIRHKDGVDISKFA